MNPANKGSNGHRKRGKYAHLYVTSTVPQTIDLDPWEPMEWENDFIGLLEPDMSLYVHEGTGHLVFFFCSCQTLLKRVSAVTISPS